MTKKRIFTWYLYLDWRTSEHYILKLNKKDFIPDEIELCIDHQIYNNEFWAKGIDAHNN